MGFAPTVWEVLGRWEVGTIALNTLLDRVVWAVLGRHVDRLVELPTPTLKDREVLFSFLKMTGDLEL